ncbi:transcriptional regulator [Spirillospora sp. NBC_01491]|uniref:transcriptional regulator n=1 Tax=Spirillospora sp. NBC_01491 TaxID=2976007 RepID=UPI002E3787D7|nr:transcriptional regulator [Spirillospora sp. NBC_01491]
MTLGRFGGVYAALHAGQCVGDVWTQTDWCARTKGNPGADGRRACTIHVATLTATQATFLGLAVAATGEQLSIRRTLLGLTLNAASHYAMDRRDHGVMPLLTKAMSRWGKDKFAALGQPPLATGAAALDKAWHIGWCAIAAAIITGRN